MVEALLVGLFCGIGVTVLLSALLAVTASMLASRCDEAAPHDSAVEEVHGW